MSELIGVGDFEFTVDVAGPEGGAPVLFLHGFPQSRRSWAHQIEALSAAGYRCIAPDQRGYSPGARPAEDAAYAVPGLVSDALGLMDALGHDRFHLVGHDWGGQLSWLIAAHFAPEQLISLAVLSRPHPAAFAHAMRADAGQAGRSQHHRTLQDAGAAAAIRANDFAGFRRMFETQHVPKATADAYIDLLAEPGAVEGAIAWYRGAPFAALPGADVPAVAAPTLYLWGDEDATVSRTAAEATAAHVSGPYQFEVIEGGGHFLSDQFPERVSALLLEHLGAR